MKKSKNILLYAITLLLVVSIFLIIKTHPSNGVSNLEKIDVHEHIKDMSQIERLLPIMNELNISKMILLNTPDITFSQRLGPNTTGMSGIDSQMEELFRIKEKYPDRFYIYPTVNPYDPHAVEKLDGYLKRGADGIKIYNGVITSLGPFNTSFMYKVYQKAREYGVPLVIHVEALNTTQLPEFEQVLRDFPDLKIICPHFCGSASNLVFLQNLLDKYQNLSTDISAWHRVGLASDKGGAEPFKTFVIKNQDRIMFGSDIVLDDVFPNQASIGRWFRCDTDLLERDFYSCYRSRNDTSEGWNLPENVLRKIYLENAEKFLKKE